MNSEGAQSEWARMRGKISSKWSKFSEGEVEKFRDNMGAISEKIQKAYGHSKERADREYDDFRKTLAEEDSVSKDRLT